MNLRPPTPAAPAESANLSHQCKAGCTSHNRRTITVAPSTRNTSTLAPASTAVSSGTTARHSSAPIRTRPDPPRPSIPSTTVAVSPIIASVSTGRPSAFRHNRRASGRIIPRHATDATQKTPNCPSIPNPACAVASAVTSAATPKLAAKNETVSISAMSRQIPAMVQRCHGCIVIRS